MANTNNDDFNINVHNYDNNNNNNDNNDNNNHNKNDDKDNNNDDKNKNDTTLKKVGKELLDLAKTIAIAIVAAYLITNFVIVNAVVPTPSMAETIQPKDRLIAFRLSYLFSTPERGDIVVFKYPDDESTLFVKRVIALPGETINIVDGKIYIDSFNTPLDDDYLTEPMLGSFGPYTVPEDSYFMLGDNRNDSKDSRFWENKFVKKDKILGKVIFKYYPKIELLLNK